jgi:hypothetical protein
MPNFQGIWSLSEQYQNAGIWPLPPLTGDIGLFFGNQNVIQWIQITTTGNSQDFGDLTTAADLPAVAASSTRAVRFGGGGASLVIDFVTISTRGNATNFGNMVEQVNNYLAGCGNSTRGVAAGGNVAAGHTNTIQYVTIATEGNATDFGDLTAARASSAGFSSTTRGVWAGGNPTGASTSNVIDYVTIATTGNATDFGDIAFPAAADGKLDLCAGASSSTRGLIFNGTDGGAFIVNNNIIQYVTIASTGNTTDFGDTAAVSRSRAATSNGTRGIVAGGIGTTNVIEYVTIASTGNATDFGDLITGTSAFAGGSNAHGGL